MEPKEYDYEVQITTGQFEYINLKERGTTEESVMAYRNLKAAYSGQGITPEAFQAFVYRQVRGDDNHVEEYNQMSDEQKGIVQAVKRAMKTIKK